jgi:hypothetical protein
VLEKVSLAPGNGPDELVLQRAGEDPVTVHTEEVLTVDMGKVPTRLSPPSVRCINGDQVIGAVSFLPNNLVKVSAGWGSMTVPLGAVSYLRIDDAAPAPAPVTRDTLILKNDRLEAEIQSVANGKVTVLLAGRAVPIELSRIQAIALAPRARLAEDGKGLQIRADLGGGERLTGRWVKLGKDLLTLRPEWGGSIDVPVASLSRLEVRNGKLVYLSDLKPAEERQVPYLDTPFPLQLDRSAAGRPIRIAGRTYARGLGMHSRASVTYQLDGTYRAFAATAGIDDAVGDAGSVIVRVYGDDKLLFESPILHGGDEPAQIRVDLTKVLLLRLEVDYADNADAGDQADWAEARLLR